MRLSSLPLIALLVLSIAAHPAAVAASLANAKSPLGMNLLNVNYYTEEQPFLNLFKTTGITKANPKGWWTAKEGTWDTGEEASLQLDASGYPTSLLANPAVSRTPQLYDRVSVLLERDLGKSNTGTSPYRSGQYIVLYAGKGTLNYSGDARLVKSSPGRDVIDVASPSGGGILMQIVATDPGHNGNYLHDIRVVKAEEESLLAAGNVYSPRFLSLMKNFRVLRFMQWLNVNAEGGNLINWQDRPQPLDGGWGGLNGVPLEIVVQLCNKESADCWLNVPHQASDDYIAQMAALVHSSLDATQNVYVELSNEVWNDSFPQAAYATSKGRSLWPSAGSVNYNGNWYGMRTAQMCDIWKAAWRADAPRVICVMGAQAVNPDTAKAALNCPLWSGRGNAPCAAHGIGVVAIAPYLFVEPQSSWTANSDRGLASLFFSLTLALSEVSADEARYKTALAAYKLPLIAYEGGQSLIGASGPDMQQLFVAANRDARMQGVYTKLLKDWQANGGQLFAAYASIAKPGQYGEWGALESFLDSVEPLSSAPPKWAALQNFIAQTPCWWDGCGGAVAAKPGP